MKKLIAFILTLTLVCLITAIPVFAAEKNIMPISDDESGATVAFGIDSDGNATARVIYSVPVGTVRSVNVTILVEKKFLLFFWTEVDSWSATFTEDSFIYTETFSASSGTHRATFTIEVTAADGTTENYTKQIEAAR